MSRIFLDTNVILDLLGERVPFFDSIAKVATLADQKKLTLIVSPLSFTTVDYVLNKYARNCLKKEQLRLVGFESTTLLSKAKKKFSQFRPIAIDMLVKQWIDPIGYVKHGALGNLKAHHHKSVGDRTFY